MFEFLVLCVHPCADILYVTATTSSMVFKAAVDTKSLRMLAVSMPGTLSFGDILIELGVTSAASVGDVLTVTATTVVYVPVVNGSGEKKQQTLCKWHCWSDR